MPFNQIGASRDFYNRIWPIAVRRTAQSELGRRGGLRHGLTWHFDRPPVVDLEYEMDCRRVNIERVIEV
jgi:hypothetical protein